MKNLMKFILALSISLGALVVTKAQSDTITDCGDYIKFKAGTYAISNISKDNIKSVELVSSTEVRVVTDVASGNKWFDVDYQEWVMSNDSTFANVTELESYLLKIWKKEYYHVYSYDLSDNLTQHKQYWIFDSDTVEVKSDTLTYTGTNLIGLTSQE